MDGITHLKITNQPKLLENYLVVDFETYWCTLTGYKLGKMNVDQYGRNPRFEILLVWVVASKGEDNTIIQPSDELRNDTWAPYVEWYALADQR
jgi:hypothetical protein